jgi:hypothetical protein
MRLRMISAEVARSVAPKSGSHGSWAGEGMAVSGPPLPVGFGITNVAW